MPRPEPRLVTFEIDGREVTAPEGAMLVDGAKYGDVEIPYFCYERKLGQPVGACRMCLVEIEGIPKLQTSCSTPVKDGMVVVTTSDRVKEAQEAIVEFLLVNHPLDCPVCDKGGECPLQDFSYTFGPAESRMDFPRRVFDGEGVKADVDFGPTLMLNRNRCILCTRCVRFMREVDTDAQINIVDRGYGSEIATFQERGVIRISCDAFAHSGFAFSHALVLQPFEQSVQIVSTTAGLSQGRLLNR